MEERESHDEHVNYRIQQLQRERDELRKDIEQLCLQQAGPGYLAVATKMHFERIAALEQEIESLHKKLSGCLREKHNLQEELSEAYRIKSQLADLHAAELQKNMEAEKQVKFFQGCVAAAFAERDNSLMESEKAKEREEAMSQRLTDCEKRVEELESSYLDEKELRTSLQLELSGLKKQFEILEKVANRFYEIRATNTGFSRCNSLEDKCSSLLDDPSDSWVFNSNCETPASKYITSLEREREILRNSMQKLQKNLRMGLDIEQHLRRNLHSLEKREIMLDSLIRNGLSTLRSFLAQYKVEVLGKLEEVSSTVATMLVEVQEKFSQTQISLESTPVAVQTDEDFDDHQREERFDNTEYRDVHITTDNGSSETAKSSDISTSTMVIKGRIDAGDPLAQALREKVAALLLLSQEEERHLLEENVIKAQQEKLQELQRNLSQVTNEKVSVLMELAELKRGYQLLKENISHCKKCDNQLVDSSSITVQDQEGKLKNILRKTYLRRWIVNDHGQKKDSTKSTDHTSEINKQDNSSMDLVRLRVEHATLQESIANLEHLTSLIHRLRSFLLKVQNDVTSLNPSEGTLGTLSNVVTEANQLKTALSSSLPLSWSGDGADAIACDNLEEPPDISDTPRSKKIDAVSAAGLEMVELLLMASAFLKEILQLSL